MAREGLRTLVVGKKVLTEETYSNFEVGDTCDTSIELTLTHLQARYRQAKLSVSDRSAQVSAVVQSLEDDLQLLCITGVEDQLQVYHSDHTMLSCIIPVLL